MIVPYNGWLNDPSLKEIVRHFFGCERFDEYIESQSVWRSVRSEPFHFGPTLICHKRIFQLFGYSTISEIRESEKDFRLVSPKYSYYEFISICMRMSFLPEQVANLTNQKIYALAFDEENMELLNFNELQTR